MVESKVALIRSVRDRFVSIKGDNRTTLGCRLHAPSQNADFQVV